MMAMYNIISNKYINFSYIVYLFHNKYKFGENAFDFLVHVSTLHNYAYIYITLICKMLLSISRILLDVTS